MFIAKAIYVTVDYSVVSAALVCLQCDLIVDDAKLIFIASGSYLAGLVVTARETIVIQRSQVQVRLDGSAAAGIVNKIPAAMTYFTFLDSTLTAYFWQSSSNNGYLSSSVQVPLLMALVLDDPILAIQLVLTPTDTSNGVSQDGFVSVTALLIVVNTSGIEAHGTNNGDRNANWTFQKGFFELLNTGFNVLVLSMTTDLATVPYLLVQAASLHSDSTPKYGEIDSSGIFPPFWAMIWSKARSISPPLQPKFCLSGVSNQVQLKICCSLTLTSGFWLSLFLKLILPSMRAAVPKVQHELQTDVIVIIKQELVEYAFRFYNLFHSLVL
ncbi:Hypothetical_protein [Hexamita inflata]|uniref:Hypothetical_protein n=1 Tax=Hexamita inflata TaxID=28002 RepID=A0AA86NHF7_9EUKA|nr:Hypothetical protein HINF_LOCUS7509 [Hexamita inflata]